MESDAFFSRAINSATRARAASDGRNATTLFGLVPAAINSITSSYARIAVMMIFYTFLIERLPKIPDGLINKIKINKTKPGVSL